MAKEYISKSYLKRNHLYIVVLVLLFEYVYTRFFFEENVVDAWPMEEEEEKDEVRRR